jgi:hypothetical protein
MESIGKEVQRVDFPSRSSFGQMLARNSLVHHDSYTMIHSNHDLLILRVNLTQAKGISYLKLSAYVDSGDCNAISKLHQ